MTFDWLFTDDGTRHVISPYLEGASCDQQDCLETKQVSFTSHGLIDHFVCASLFPYLCIILTRKDEATFSFETVLLSVLIPAPGIHC